MDEHVPSAITDALRRRGIDVVSVQEDGRAGLPDPLVIDRATELGRVLFTRDMDFLAEVRQRQREGRAFAGVVYAHQMRVSIGTCIDDLKLLAGASEPAELADRVVFLPLRKRSANGTVPGA